MAESEGFEPSVHLTTDTCLAGKPIRPLWQLSENIYYRRKILLLTPWTVLIARDVGFTW